jgi:uncharacterized protein (DUF1501 family)
VSRGLFSSVVSRRDFLKKSSSVALASALAKNSAGVISLLNASNALGDSEDYRALVFVFLNGGNDAFNMVVPLGGGQLRANYENSRGVVALAEDELNGLNLQSTPKVYGDIGSSDFGFHGQCSDMAEIFNRQEMAVLCNIGNLVAPVTREQYLGTTEESIVLPPRLFSHSDQQRQFQSEPTGQFSYGWGGRLAELLGSHNNNPLLSPLISVAGLNPFQVSLSGQVNTYTLGTNGIVPLTRFTGARSTMVSNAMSSIDSSSHLMAQKYTDIFGSAVTAQSVVESVFSIAESSGVDFDGIFTAAGVATDSVVGRRLKTVAKMIKGRSASSNKRPIYFVEMNGFDTHANMLPNHSNLMTELNSALKAFRDVLNEQGDFDKVLTYVGSEFARTLTPNGNDPASSGTDHAWGGHALAMGGMVDGGKFFGTHPDLTLNQNLDVGGRGRFLPTNSSSQCAAVIANWMGVAESDINQIFPSLDNFPSPFALETNINFIKTV